MSAIRDTGWVRITLNLDDDVLASAKAEAIRQGKSLGELVSSLLRGSLGLDIRGPGPSVRNGIPLFPIRSDARAVTPEIVRQLLADT